MGIIKFHKWLRDKYPNQYKSIKKPMHVEHLYIDINFVLHNCVYGTKKKEQLYKKVFGFIDNVLKVIIPTKTITLASDGPAPYAKLLLQRERRLQMTRKMEETIDEKTASPLYFTPGSIFMKNLEEKLSNYIDELEKNLNITAYRILRGTDEAEIKIVNKLLELNKDKNEKHIILSNDADIIVMLMSLQCYENLYISIRYKGFYIFDINNLVKSIETELKINEQDMKKKFHKDFSLGFLLMGNDYLPKVKYISVEKIYTAFQNTYEYIEKIKHTENIDHVFLDKDYKLNKEVFRDFIFNIINITSPGFINKFEITKFNKDQYQNYIEGLLWCIQMYSTGKCHRYDYLYKYNDSPHLLGLLHYLDFYYDDDINSINIINTSKPIPEDLYCILVLPKKAQLLISSNYHNLINKNLQFLYEEEECDTCYKKSREISSIYESIKCMENFDEDSTELRKKAGIICSELGTHKKIHKNLTIEDIKLVINLFEKFI